VGPDYNNRFGAGSAYTILHPVIAVAMILACVLVLLLPRKYMMVPFTLFVIFTPFGQQVYVAGAHLFTDRIVILIGLARMVMTKFTSDEEIVPWGLNSIDKMFLASTCFGAIATVLLFREMGAVVNQVGALWDAIGGYFLIRFMIQDKEDIARFIKILAGSLLVLATTMLNETIRGQNVFGFIGGRLAITVRDGAIRAQGPFAGPIVAGTFGATALCFFVWLWKTNRSKTFAVVGIIGCTVVAFTSNSSTPLLAYMASLMGLSMWFLRRQMRIIRWGIVITLISLHLVMKVPVWFLINHVDLIAGNSGFHRAMLVNDLIVNFKEWWLVGVETTKNWGWDMWDQANQFVAVGETGGLLALIFFIWMISKSFGWLGGARKIVNGDTKKEWELYLLAAVLFSYVVSFFGISFSRGAEVCPWYALFAMIAVLATPVLHATAVADPNINQTKTRHRLKYASPAISTRTQTLR
jgi:hypothetical protein